MTIAEHTATALVLHDKPWLESVVGVLFVIGGVVAFVSGERVFGGGFVAAGTTILLLFANVITNRFDRSSGQFSRISKGLIRRRETGNPLADIKGVQVEASRSGDPSRNYRVVLALKSGGRVPLTTAYSSGRIDKEQLAATIRSFLGLPEVAPTDGPGFGEMVRTILKADGLTGQRANGPTG